jgi:predicted pyridoxine 5'-phosphate oxidase superfamily flavin-nucleotide-binding protein
MITSKIKKLIETNPMAMATADAAGKPNLIGVAFAKVAPGGLVIITDNYMRQTLKNLKKNKSVCLAVWDKKWKGCKLIGSASYQQEGKWASCVKHLPENKGLPAKGAVVVKVSKVIPFK